MARPPLKHFFSAADLEPEYLPDGIVRYCYTGNDLQILEYRFQPHTPLPMHHHDTVEQLGRIIEGSIAVTVGGEERILRAGDYYHAPIGVEHGARTLDEPTVVIDVFTPPREDLIK